MWGVAPYEFGRMWLVPHSPYSTRRACIIRVHISLNPLLFLTEPFDYMHFRFMQIKLQGFNVRAFVNRRFEGAYQIRDWILEVDIISTDIFLLFDLLLK